MRIAIIALEFPPYNSGGAYRPFRFASQLQQNGVDIVVFSVNNYDKSGQWDQNSLLFKLPFKTIRSPLKTKHWSERFLKDYYFSLSERLGKYWRKSLRTEFAIEQELASFDNIIVTAPPFSVLQEAFYLSKRYSIPLITDFRDAWSQWCITPFSSRAHYILTKRAELKILSHSSLFIVPTEEVGEDLIRVHGEKYKEKIFFLPNGFPENIRVNNIIDWKYEKGQKITIGYAGSFYFNPVSHNLIYRKWWQKKWYQYLQFVPRKENWLYRSPYFFFKGIRKLLDLYPEFLEKLEIRIAGKQPIWIYEMAKELDLQKNVKFIGYVQKSEMDAFYKTCDLLLATSIKIENGKDYCIGGKTYDYFMHQKPILGLVCEGAQKKILRDSGLALLCDPDKPDDLVQTITHIDEKVKKLKIDLEFLKNFEASNQVSQLLNRIMALKISNHS